MQNTRGLLIVATMASMAGLAACGGGATTIGGAGASGGSAVDAAAASIADAGDDDDTLPVVCPPDAPDSTSLASGMSAKGSKITAVYKLSDPSPPERYDNDWTIDFVDANGAAVTDITTTASTWMPYHGHGWPGTTTPMATPGEIKATLNFNMRGYFRIDLGVTSKSLGADKMSLYYCLR